MRGNTYGKLFSITTAGESHGHSYIVIIDGMPSNISISEKALAQRLRERSPGHIPGTSTRKEEDLPIILSGIFEGKTLGTPIAIQVKNQDARSQDYNLMRNSYRPGHADKTTILKYSIRDHRGGGRSSGRETLTRVIGGYFAQLILPSEVLFHTYIKKLGPFEALHTLSKAELDLIAPPFYFPGTVKTQEDMATYLLQLQKNGESIGGILTCKITRPPKALGEPCFDKLKADLGKAILSIGAVMGIQFGNFHDLVNSPGSKMSLSSQNFAGIEGGISNGDAIIFDVIIKPTSTIGIKATEGRHDPCILPRARVVIESMTKIVLADHLLRQRAYNGF